MTKFLSNQPDKSTLTAVKHLVKRALKLGLSASYAIQPGNEVGLFYSSWTYTGLE